MLVRRLPMAALLASLCVLGVLPKSLRAQAAGAPGVLVDVGGHDLYLHCDGPAGGGPTVILEAGAGDTSSRWSEVQEILSARVRTCAYDRAGLGRSAPGPLPRTMRQEVFELHALLRAAKLSGPFVLAGHSMGGLLVRLYAEQYPGEVVGMVLVDPMHENSRQGRVLAGESQPQLVRVRELATGRPIPEPRREAGVQQQDDPREDYLPEELERMHQSRHADPQPLGDRPLIVIHGTRPRPAPPDVPAEEWNDLQHEKTDEKADLARLSRNARFIRDPSSGHHVHVDNPRLVARAIEQVIESAAAGTRLTP